MDKSERIKLETESKPQTALIPLPAQCFKQKLNFAILLSRKYALMDQMTSCSNSYQDSEIKDLITRRFFI